MTEAVIYYLKSSQNEILCIINILMKKDLCLKFCTFASELNLEFLSFLILRYYLLPSKQASNLSQTWEIFLSPEEYCWEAIVILSCIWFYLNDNSQIHWIFAQTTENKNQETIKLSDANFHLGETQMKIQVIWTLGEWKASSPGIPYGCVTGGSTLWLL